MRQCEDRHWWYVGLHELATSTLTEQLRVRPDGQVLDAGCGTGGWMAKCRDSAEQTIGLEYSPDAFRELESRGLPHLVRGDLRRMPFHDKVFDFVASFDVLGILHDAEAESAFDELVRLVRPGGRLMLNLPAFQWLRSDHDAFVGNRKRFTTREVSDALRRRGMQVECATYRMTFLFPIAAAVRVLKRSIRTAQAPAASDVRMPPVPINALLTSILRVENALIRRGWRLPFGLSVCVVAAMPEMHDDCRGNAV
jgi:SAM-dependent methyltransferase